MHGNKYWRYLAGFKQKMYWSDIPHIISLDSQHIDWLPPEPLHLRLTKHSTEHGKHTTKHQT